MIGQQSRLVRNSDVLHADLSKDSVALMSVANSAIYGLDGPAGKIWELLATERSLDELFDVLVQLYDVERSTCAKDVTAFLEKLEANNLISVS